MSMFKIGDRVRILGFLYTSLVGDNVGVIDRVVTDNLKRKLYRVRIKNGKIVTYQFATNLEHASGFDTSDYNFVD